MERNELNTRLQCIETVVADQLKEIDERIDRRYRKYGTGAGAMLLTSMAAFRMTTTVTVFSVAVNVAIGPILGVIGGLWSARRNHRQLAELLKIKKQVASSNASTLSGLLPEIQAIYDESVVLFTLSAGKEYDVDSEAKLEAACAEFRESLDLCRRAAYCLLSVQFLDAEYTAWTAGEQQSELQNPTIFDANRLLLATLDIPQSLDDLFSPIAGRVWGAKLLALADAGLLAAATERYGVGSAATACSDYAYASFRDGTVERAYMSAKTGIVKRLLSKNRTYTRLCRRFRSVGIRRRLGGNVTAALVGGGAAMWGLLKLFSGWTAWLQWTAGLLLGLLAFVLWIVAIVLSVTTRKNTRMRTRRNTFRLLRRLGGDPGTRRKVIRKDYVSEGVKGYFGI